MYANYDENSRKALDRVANIEMLLCTQHLSQKTYTPRNNTIF